MLDILIENGVSIVATLVITLIGVFGAWLEAKLAKKTELENINAAQQEVIAMAKQTVGELQQTLVEELKAASADGKLTNAEVVSLGEKLYNKTQAKISAAAKSILQAANVDLGTLIRGAAEDWILTLRSE